MSRNDDAAAIEAAFRKMNLPAAQKHIFLCVGPDCCPTEQGLAVWETLKQAVKNHSASVLRTKAACLRVCCGGPWMVVYPEGIWYGAVTSERCERIVREHILEGRPVEEWIQRVHPLAPPELSPE